MTAQTIPFYGDTNRSAKKAPVTARGRALHTVAWFMNGSAQAINYDHRYLSIQDIVTKNV